MSTHINILKKLHIPRVVVAVLIFVLLVICQEVAVRIFMPQLTYSDAMKYSPDYNAPDPYLPVVLKKSAYNHMLDAHGDFDVTGRINSLGYRGKEFTVKKTPGTVRILIVGDSMTYGYGLPDNETYPAQVEKILKARGFTNIEVINAGNASGFSPDSYYLYLKTRGLDLKPDIVLMGFFIWSDWTDLSETVWENVDNSGLPTKITSCCNMVDGDRYRNKTIDFKYKYPILRESHLYLFFIGLLQKKFGWFARPVEQIPKRDSSTELIMFPGDTTYEEEYQKTLKVLQATKDLTMSHGVDFSVVLLPFDGQFNPDIWLSYGYGPYPADRNYPQQKISASLENMGVRYLDLFSAFDSQKDNGPTSFSHDQHWNAWGAKIAASAIVDYLQKYEFLKK